MTQKQPGGLLGRLAVQYRLVTPEQLAEAVHDLGGGGETDLGEALIARGLVTTAQLQKLLQIRQQVVEKHRAAQAQQAQQPRPEGAARPMPPARPAPTSRPNGPGGATAAPPATSRPAPPARPAATSRPTAPESRSASHESPESRGLGLAFAAAGDAARERLEAILRDAVGRGASDVHLHAGSPLRLRLNGTLCAAGDRPLAPDEVEQLAASALGEEARADLARAGEIDVCYTLAGVGRFRANVYRQQRGFDAVFRAIPPAPPTLEQLGLPAQLGKLTEYHQGMLLVTGPAGCGKSSTLAALVNLLNESRREHILTVEDPIEYVHPSKGCLVNQRHAGRHTKSFARALRGALREDPDIIVIGELRDLETISLALTAAETGHFVLATLHTNNAVRTINRMVGSFPSREHEQIRSQLSESLRAVVSQRLVARKDGKGRVPALEILKITRAVSNLIRENKTIQIRSVLQTGASQGMCLLDTSLAELVRKGAIDKAEALRHAEDPKFIPDK